MECGEAEDAGGLSPAKDDNEAARYFIRQTLLILRCVDYILGLFLKTSTRLKFGYFYGRGPRKSTALFQRLCH